MQFRVPVVSLVLILAIAACGRRDPVANGANAVTAIPEPANDTAPTPLGGPPENKTEPAADAPAPIAEATIPAALQGRWGLAPGDCRPSADNAKGLLVISGSELRFYESRAVPSSNIESDSDSINGTFRFTGEGQAWDKFETLQRSGDKLTRTETNPAASYTYAKC
jgi:predicted small lipoprotein YifL